MSENNAPSVACLLLHGFAGSPFEMEPLVPALEALGCAVELPALPGHGASIPEFRRTFFPDWLAFAEERYLALTRAYDIVIPIGFSMGGSIALCLAARHNPAAAACLAPVYTLFSRYSPPRNMLKLMLLPLLMRLMPELPMPAPKAASRALAPSRGYESPMCLPQLHSLGQGLILMRELLPKVRCPLLLMHEVRDRICPPQWTYNIARDTASTDILMRWLRMNERITSHHMLTTHAHTKDKVAAEVAGFVRRFAG